MTTTPSSTSAHPALPDAELLSRYDVAGPRYTSYPTADRFVNTFGIDNYTPMLLQRSQDKRQARYTHPLSVYVHIPFCESLCYYCACNKIITKHRHKGVQYLDYLQQELNLHLTHLGRGQPVSQLHLGGGTPTFLDDDGIARLMGMFRDAFVLVPDGEYSVEVDPRTVTVQRLQALWDLGFNRLSFGVQDFDENVQKAVHRIQPAQQVFDLVAAARQIGFQSINVDLIYGLPLQTAPSFARTLEQVCTLRPDRVALYAYAHLPERFKPQRRIDAYTLPGATEKVSMLAQSLQAFGQAGYTYIGMDHFALPDDALAIARQQKRLHRNFQGYSTQPDSDLLALGVSAIGRMGNTYSQNEKTLEGYYAALDAGRLPIVRGLVLSDDDCIRRSVIMELMCQGEIIFADINQNWGIDFAQYFAPELERLHQQQAEGMVRISDSAITVTDQGWYFVRGVAMQFDRYLQQQPGSTRFSKIL